MVLNSLQYHYLHLLKGLCPCDPEEPLFEAENNGAAGGLEVGEGETGRESKFYTKKGPGRWAVMGREACTWCGTTASGPPGLRAELPLFRSLCLHPSWHTWWETGGALNDGNGEPLRLRASQWPPHLQLSGHGQMPLGSRVGEGKAGLSGGLSSFRPRGLEEVWR